MNDELRQSVYNTLKEATEEIGKLKAELNKLSEKANSGVYSKMTLTNDILPAISSVKRQIETRTSKAAEDAKGLVTAYKAKMKEADSLKGSEITEDAALFSAGVKLTAEDILAILNRNEGNATMQQLAIRYAAENKIDIGNVTYVGHTRDMQEADGINTAISYYAGWIDKDNALDMLDRFFSVTDE